MARQKRCTNVGIKLGESDPFFTVYNHDSELRMGNHGKTGLWQIEAYHISAGYFHKSKQYLIVHNTVGRGGGLREEKRCKGMTATSLQEMTRIKYKEVVTKDRVIPLDIKLIRSFSHSLFQITVRKLCFHALNISRVFLNVNKSYPLGYHKLPELMREENIGHLDI